MPSNYNDIRVRVSEFEKRAEPCNKIIINNDIRLKVSEFVKGLNHAIKP